MASAIDRAGGDVVVSDCHRSTAASSRSRTAPRSTRCPPSPAPAASSPTCDRAEQLTSEEITAPVQYVFCELSPDQIARFEAGPVTLVADHAHYVLEAPLSADTTAELTSNLVRGGGRAPREQGADGRWPPYRALRTAANG